MTGTMSERISKATVMGHSTGGMLAIGHHLPSVIQMQSQAEAEFLAAANDIRESANHPADGQHSKQESTVWGALAEVLSCEAASSGSPGKSRGRRKFSTTTVTSSAA